MKKTNFVKTIAVLAATASFCTSIAALPSSAATYGTRERLVEVAEKYYNQGATAATFGFNTEWCALFAHKCVNEAGGKDYSSSSSTTQTLLDYRENGKYHAKKTNSWSYSTRSCPTLTQDTNYTPQIGDIALVETNNNLSDGPDHTVLVVKVEGTGINAKVYTIEGNVNGSSWSTTTVGRDYWVNAVWGFCSPDYADSSVDPTPAPSSGVTSYLNSNSVIFKNVTYPIKQKAGGTFDVYGTINSTSKISSVTVDIDEITSSGKYVNVDKTIRYPNATYFNLHSIDDRIWFNRASKKNTSYRYRITVKTANGKTAYHSKVFKTF